MPDLTNYGASGTSTATVYRAKTGNIEYYDTSRPKSQRLVTVKSSSSRRPGSYKVTKKSGEVVYRVAGKTQDGGYVRDIYKTPKDSGSGQMITGETKTYSTKAIEYAKPVTPKAPETNVQQASQTMTIQKATPRSRLQQATGYLKSKTASLLSGGRTQNLQDVKKYSKEVLPLLKGNVQGFGQTVRKVDDILAKNIQFDVGQRKTDYVTLSQGLMRSSKKLRESATKDYSRSAFTSGFLSKDPLKQNIKTKNGIPSSTNSQEISDVNSFENLYNSKSGQDKTKSMSLQSFADNKRSFLLQSPNNIRNSKDTKIKNEKYSISKGIISKERNDIQKNKANKNNIILKKINKFNFHDKYKDAKTYIKNFGKNTFYAGRGYLKDYGGVLLKSASYVAERPASTAAILYGTGKAFKAGSAALTSIKNPVVRSYATKTAKTVVGGAIAYGITANVMSKPTTREKVATLGADLTITGAFMGGKKVIEKLPKLNIEQISVQNSKGNKILWKGISANWGKRGQALVGYSNKRLTVGTPNPAKPIKFKISKGDIGHLFLEPKYQTGKIVKLYHGTNLKNYNKIMSEGLKSSKELNQQGKLLSSGERFVQEPFISTTLNKNIAKAYAGSKGKIIEINLPKEKFKKLWESNKAFQDPFSTGEPNIAFESSISKKYLIPETSNKRLTVGTPKIDLPKKNVNLDPATSFETGSKAKILQKSVLGDDAKKLEYGLKLMRATEKTPSKFLKKQYTRDVKTLSEKQVDEVLKWTGKRDGEVYGSYSAEAQMPKTLSRKPGDIDVQLDVSEEKAIQYTKDLVKQLRGKGKQVRISKESPTLIESKDGKQWNHAVDIHHKGEIENPAAAIYGEKSFGLKMSQKPVYIEYIKGMRLSEQGIRKGTSIYSYRDGKLQPAAHRTKDIPDFFATQETLIKSKTPIKQTKLQETLESLKKLYPEDLITNGKSQVQLLSKRYVETVKSPGIVYAMGPRAPSAKSPGIEQKINKVSGIEEIYPSSGKKVITSKSKSFMKVVSKGIISSSSKSKGLEKSPSRSIPKSQSKGTSPSKELYKSMSKSISKSISKSGYKSPYKSPSKSKSRTIYMSPSRSTSKSPSRSTSKSKSRSIAAYMAQPYSPPKSPYTSLYKSTKPGRTSQGYYTEVKIKGKWQKLDKIRSRESALGAGARKVDQSAAASFRIKKSDRKVTEKRSDPYFEKFKQKYRRPKRGFQDSYVEKSRYRISTAGELNQITKKGLAKQKQKMRSFM